MDGVGAALRCYAESFDSSELACTAAVVCEDKAKAFEEQIRKNMTMFEDTMKFFAPFVPTGVPGTMPGMPGTTPAAPPRSDESKPAAPPTGVDAIRALQQQMMDMQRQLAQLATGGYVPAPDKDKDKDKPQ